MHYRTFQEIADSTLRDSTYDWAVPQDWFNEVCDCTPHNPSGHIVWLYDNTFGRPFALTLLGHIILTIYTNKQRRLSHVHP